MTDLPLPPLPEPEYRGNNVFGWTATQFQSYAREYGRMVQERCAAMLDEMHARQKDRPTANSYYACAAAAIRANKEAA